MNKYKSESFTLYSESCLWLFKLVQVFTLSRYTSEIDFNNDLPVYVDITDNGHDP